MKFLFALFFTALFLVAPDLTKIREDYINAVHNKENAEKLYNDLADITKSDKKILVAYKGAVTTLKAKFAKNTSDKKELFKEGATLIEYAAAEDPDNIEIRCIRLGVQENTPKVVKYRKNIPEDKQYILDYYNEITSSNLKSYIKGFILHSKSFSEQEKEIFK